MKQAGGIEYLETKGKTNHKTIILFHGFGANAYDLASLGDLLPGPTWIFPNGPLHVTFAPGFSGRSWFPVNITLLKEAIEKRDLESIQEAFPKELSEVRKKVLKLIAELNIPLSQIILGGFSQGAVLAIEIAVHGNEKPAGLMLFSGTLIQEHVWKPLLYRLKDVPFFQSHGFFDPLLPMDRAKDLENFLLDAGLKGKLHAFQGGHEIPSSILLEAKKFLVAQNA